MLSWFNGVSYVFNFCSYVLGGCNGWVPMHFKEMDHLPYKHSSFHSYFGCSLSCSINHLFRLWCFMPSISLSLVVCLCVPPDLMQIIVFSTWSGSILVEVLQINNYFWESFVTSTCFSGILHDHLLFLSFGTFPTLEAFSVLH